VTESKVQLGSNSDGGLWSLGIEPEGTLADSHSRRGEPAEEAGREGSSPTAAPVVAANASSGKEADASVAGEEKEEVSPPPTPAPNRITVRGVLSKRELANEEEETLDDFAAQAMELEHATAALVVKKDTRFKATTQVPSELPVDGQRAITQVPNDDAQPTESIAAANVTNATSLQAATKPKTLVGKKKISSTTKPLNSTLSSSVPKKKLKPQRAATKPKQPTEDS
jgi:hypothetical protein